MVGGARWTVPRGLILLICVLYQCSLVSSSYLGCFRLSKISKFAVRSSGRTTLTNCAKTCLESKSAFYGLTNAQKCICGSLIPDPDFLLADAQCSRAAPDTAYLNYLYDKDPQNTFRCKVDKLVLGPTTVDIPWGKERSTFNKGMLSMPLKNGYDGGRALPKMNSFLYGMISVQAKISGANRPVTAFYLASETVFPYQTKWVELDVEWINEAKGKDIGPGTVWTNLFYNGQEVAPNWLKESKLRQMTKSNQFSTYTGFHTYSMNWQSRSVDWHVDGEWVDQRLPSHNISIPDKPMWPIISLWSSPDKCQWFGGCGPTNVDYFSYFQDIRRVTCAPGGTIPAAPGGQAAMDLDRLADSLLAAMKQCGVNSVFSECREAGCCAAGQTCMAFNDTFWGCTGEAAIPGDSLLAADREQRLMDEQLQRLPKEPVSCGNPAGPFVDVACAPGWDCIQWNTSFWGCVRMEIDAGSDSWSSSGDGARDHFGGDSGFASRTPGLLAGHPCDGPLMADMPDYAPRACSMPELECQKVAKDLALCMPATEDRERQERDSWDGNVVEGQGRFDWERSRADVRDGWFGQREATRDEHQGWNDAPGQFGGHHARDRSSGNDARNRYEGKGAHNGFAGRDGKVEFRHQLGSLTGQRCNPTKFEKACPQGWQCRPLQDGFVGGSDVINGFGGGDDVIETVWACVKVWGKGTLQGLKGAYSQRLLSPWAACGAADAPGKDRDTAPLDVATPDAYCQEGYECTRVAEANWVCLPGGESLLGELSEQWDGSDRG